LEIQGSEGVFDGLVRRVILELVPLLSHFFEKEEGVGEGVNGL
jgi:hypothetical protein